MRTTWIPLAALALLASLLPATAGGAGPLTISAVRGTVEASALEPGAAYGEPKSPKGGMLPSNLKFRELTPGRWSRVGPGTLGGSLLLRTGPKSWAHLQGGRWCVDPNSLVRIESAADFGIEVLRGRVSAVDGRRGKRLFTKYDSLRGVVAP
jgi:hypothetical protein